MTKIIILILMLLVVVSYAFPLEDPAEDKKVDPAKASPIETKTDAKDVEKVDTMDTAESTHPKPHWGRGGGRYYVSYGCGGGGGGCGGGGGGCGGGYIRYPQYHHHHGGGGCNWCGKKR